LLQEHFLKLKNILPPEEQKEFDKTLERYRDIAVSDIDTNKDGRISW
jgi:hypothetical protein